jgi:toxin ParE1/3/4
MHLEWSQFATADREGIFDYIEADSPQAAIAVEDRIRQQIEELMKFPEIGRPGRIDGTREVIIQRTPCIAVYRIAGKTI